MSRPKKWSDRQALPERKETLSGSYFFGLSKKIWTLLLISYPLDLLVLTRDFPGPAINMTQASLLICLLFSVLALAKESLLGISDTILKVQEKLTLSKGGKLPWFILGGLVILVAVELAIRLSSTQMLSIGGVIAFIAVALHSSKTMIKEKRNQEDRFAKDKILWLENANKQLFFLVTFPFVLARAVSFLGALIAHDEFFFFYSYSFYLAPSLLLFFAHSPTKENFIAICTRCSRWTSRALKKEGYCPACDRKRFQLQITSVSKDRGAPPVATSQVGKIALALPRLKNQA